MPRALFETSTPLMRDLFANGRQYSVPRFQRDYSWEEEQWDDLWADLTELGTSGSHYMGAIVLQQGSDSYTVIDGQQRLATMSLFVLAAIAILRDSAAQEPDNQQRADVLHASFIGYREAASLHSKPKLRLNHSDDGFYQTYLVKGITPPGIRSLPASQARLWRGFLHFQKAVRERFPSLSGNDIAGFVESAARALTFIQIVVEDKVSAFTVFETLNARGVELTQSDLLKNYLFSLAGPAEVDFAQAARWWGQIAAHVDARDLPQFLRHFLSSRQPYVRREALFKSLKNNVRSRDDVFQLLPELDQAAQLYRALAERENPQWLDSPETRRHLRALKLFRVEQYRPLALAALLAEWDAAQIERLLHAIVVISVRFNVIGRRNTQVLESAYNEAAMGITLRQQGLRETLQSLSAIYISDDEFTKDFALYSVGGQQQPRIAKYLLSALERHCSTTDLDFVSAGETVEHILPENPSAAWDNFAGDSRARDFVERYIWRLGNLAILPPSENRRLSNSSYQEKLEAYQQSRYEITRSIDFAEWSPTAIDRRQQQMARYATAVWRVDLLSEALS